jgi:adenylate kinase
MAIVFNGPPLCGKGTIIRKLAEAGVNQRKVEMSGVLKGLESDPVKGPIIKSCFAKGDLVPDEIAIPAFIEAWDKMPDHGATHVVLDGVVRTANQAKEIFWKIETSRLYRIIQIVVDVPLDVCRLRGQVRKRDDDSDDIILRRLKIYQDDTLPAIECLSSYIVGDTIFIDNNRDPSVTAIEIKAILDHFVSFDEEEDKLTDARSDCLALKIGMIGGTF